MDLGLMEHCELPGAVVGQSPGSSMYLMRHKALKKGLF